MKLQIRYDKKKLDLVSDPIRSLVLLSKNNL